MCSILQLTKSIKQELMYKYCNKHELNKMHKLYQTRQKFKVALCLQGTPLKFDPFIAFSGTTKSALLCLMWMGCVFPDTPGCAQGGRNWHPCCMKILWPAGPGKWFSLCTGHTSSAVSSSGPLAKERHWGAGMSAGKGNGAGKGSGAQIWSGAAEGAGGI